MCTGVYVRPFPNGWLSASSSQCACAPLKHVRAPRALSHLPVHCALCGRPLHSSRLPSGKAAPTGAVTALTFFNSFFSAVVRACVRACFASRESARSLGSFVYHNCLLACAHRDCACLAASRFLITCRVYSRLFSRISRELRRLRTCVAILLVCTLA